MKKLELNLTLPQQAINQLIEIKINEIIKFLENNDKNIEKKEENDVDKDNETKR